MSDSDSSGYEEEDGAVTYLMHNAAESGDVAALERMLGLSAEADVPPALGVLFRRLINMCDNNGSNPLHVAIINGHAECVAVLLRGGASPSSTCDGSPPLTLAACLALSGVPERAAAAAECVKSLLAAGADPYGKDDGGRTPLHWAACAGDPVLVGQLLAAAAEGQRSRVGTLVADAVAAAVAAAATATGAAEEGAAADAAEGGVVAVQLPAGEMPEPIVAAADNDGLTPLHLAAKFGHPAVISVLLEAAEATGEAAAAAAAALAAEAAAEAAAPPAPAAAVEPPPAAAIAALFPATDAAALLRAKAKLDSQTALQLAAAYGRAAAVAALMEGYVASGGSAAAAVAAADKKGRSAVDLARRRGHLDLAAALSAVLQGRIFEMPFPAAAAATSSDPAAADADAQGVAGAASSNSSPSSLSTLLIAPEECLLHRTAPEPLSRSSPEPPPENVNRLHVLTRPVTGILHNAEFSGLRWRTTGIPQAAMVDVLKCHEWSYVRGVIQACEAIADSPSSVGSLDADTAISRHSMRAALAAAGAVCAAVDEVVGGKARNAFCAVRPPGHHAGPTGVVTNPNETHGSHGFCLLSNVAIGAAYAMAVHRLAGIRRVAILDFDVHHGNGTQACVLNTAPSVRTLPIRTPYSEGLQRFPVYKPWLGDGDVHNVLFASVQGFGRRPSIGWFYPGSGATADSAIAESLKPPQTPASGAGAAAGGADTTTTPAATTPAATAPAATPPLPEDPDGEFRGGYDVTVVGGPRVINVGIPGPGGKPRMWRRAWRDKILPALMNFRPDLILVSAGFDAHKKEDLNLHYVGVTEADYEWLTGQIVEVANACCGGRVVSVLEGGYNLRGGPLASAFARSVAAHVRALAAPSTAPYDPLDSEAERAAEKAVEARKAAKAAALAAGVIAAGLATPRSAAPTPRAFPPASAAAAAAAAAGVAAAAAAAASAAATTADDIPTPMDTDRPPSSETAAAAAPGDGDTPAADGGGGTAPGGDGSGEPPSKRRRRPAVDYAALNAQLERERLEAAGGGGPGGVGGAGGE